MYKTYQSTYTTYDDVNNQLKPLTGSTVTLSDDQAIIVGYIKQASALIRNWCKRTFVPYIHTSARVRYNRSPYRVQELPDDALSITSIADTTNTTITASTYRLLDVYAQLSSSPYRYVEFSADANYATTDTNNFAPTFYFNGIWGYSDVAYDNAWLDSGADVDATLNTTSTTVTVTSSSAIKVLDYIRVGTEFMQVQSIDSGTQITVTRGVNGSTSATHAQADDIEVWQTNLDVVLACTRLASWLYMSRQNELQSVQFQDGTVAGINYPSIVRESLKPLVKPHFESVI